MLDNKKKTKVAVVGAGLAGSDAAYYLAEKGLEVLLFECKAKSPNSAQKNPDFAELVCTNSLKSVALSSAHGILKLEMKALGSLILKSAQDSAVPAGDALAVDRDQFSKIVTTSLKNHPQITLIEEEVTDPFELKEKYQVDAVILATGPLTKKTLETWIKEEVSSDDFYFYDAIAPVVDADSLDYSKLYFKDRRKETDESADYLNAPMNKEQYEAFINELIKAEKVKSHDFEDFKFFESCLPVDIMAERGIDTARFSCMRPVGLEMADGTTPYAVIQLRKENLLGDAYNLVGFQNRLTYKEQLRVFRMIPGFENAQFLKLGSVHRNSFLNARKVLNFDLSSKKYPWLYFAGQITGVEGYTESASMGLYASSQLYRKLNDQEPVDWPKETAFGALINYLMTNDRPAPSNINFGLFPKVVLNKQQRKDKRRKLIKKELAAQREQEFLHTLLANNIL